jgi:hypothetical protein
VALGGKISNEENESVEEVNVELNTGEIATTNSNGQFTFAVVPGGDYTVTPSKDDNQLNGVTTFDLVLISKHILNVQRLDSPYKIIAADINNSKSITTLDLVALRKLILRIDSKLANNTSWRFVEKSYAFPNPQNPWAAEFPEVKNFNNLPSDVLSADFVAVKVGDVNGSATPNSLLGVDVRSFNGNLMFTVKDASVKAGEEVKVNFTADQDVLGYQFTMSLNSKVAELVNIEYGVAKEANFNVAGNTIATSWNDNLPTAGQNMFTLVFRAKVDSELSEILSVSSEIIAAEAYNSNGELMGVAFDFGNGAVANADFALYQNTPNPFKGQTSITFDLPEAATATLTISDVAGKVVKVIKNDFAKGQNIINVNSTELNASGVLYYQLATDKYNATRKMVIIE